MFDIKFNRSCAKMFEINDTRSMTLLMKLT